MLIGKGSNSCMLGSRVYVQMCVCVCIGCTRAESMYRNVAIECLYKGIYFTDVLLILKMFFLAELFVLCSRLTSM